MNQQKQFKLYRIGFYALLVAFIGVSIVACKCMKVKNDLIENRAGFRGEPSVVWVELSSKNPQATLEFLERVFDTETSATRKDKDGTRYALVKTKDKARHFGKVREAKRSGDGKCPKAYLAVEDYEEARGQMLRRGAKVVSEGESADGMRTGTYMIPGELEIGIIEY